MSLISYFWNWRSAEPSTVTSSTPTQECQPETINLSDIIDNEQVTNYTVTNQHSISTYPSNTLRFLVNRESKAGEKVGVTATMKTEHVCELFTVFEQRLYGFIPIRRWADVMRNFQIWKPVDNMWVQTPSQIVDQYGNEVPTSLPLVALNGNQCYFRIPLDNRKQKILLEMTYSLLNSGVRNQLTQKNLRIDLGKNSQGVNFSILNGQLESASTTPINADMLSTLSALTSRIIFEDGIEFTSKPDVDTYLNIESIKNSTTNSDIPISKKYTAGKFMKLKPDKDFKINLRKGTPYVINFTIVQSKSKSFAEGDTTVPQSNNGSSQIELDFEKINKQQINSVLNVTRVK